MYRRLGQVAEPVEERLGRQVGQEPEPADVDAQHGRGPVAHPPRGVQHGAVAAEHQRDVGLEAREVGIRRQVDARPGTSPGLRLDRLGQPVGLGADLGLGAVAQHDHPERRQRRSGLDAHLRLETRHAAPFLTRPVENRPSGRPSTIRQLKRDGHLCRHVDPAEHHRLARVLVSAGSRREGIHLRHVAPAPAAVVTVTV